MKDVFEKNLESGVVLDALVAAGYDAKDGRFSKLNTETGKYEPMGRRYAVYVNVCGFKTEYFYMGVFRTGWNKKFQTEQLDHIFEELSNIYPDIQIEKNTVGKEQNGYCIDLHGLSTPEEFVEFCRNVEQIITGSDVITTRRQSAEKGVSFEGSNFSNAHERATTIGNRFMKMVCKASGMSDNYDSEWIVEDGGRIDAVEIDEVTEEIVSIYECQSGIQNGDYLDDTHLNKALLRYPADPAIAPTLKKIVILAGGYSKTALETIRWQAENLKTTRGIEVVLLKTTRTDDKIGVEKVELF